MAKCSQGCSEPNRPQHCPIKMSDGRCFTDYLPRCAMYNESLQNTAVASSYESRMYLQQNALKEIEKHRNKTVENLAPCYPCSQSLDKPGTQHPERYVVRCNETSCSRVELNPSGLGDGRNFT